MAEVESKTRKYLSARSSALFYSGINRDLINTKETLFVRHTASQLSKFDTRNGYLIVVLFIFVTVIFDYVLTLYYFNLKFLFANLNIMLFFSCIECL